MVCVLSLDARLIWWRCPRPDHNWGAVSHGVPTGRLLLTLRSTTVYADLVSSFLAEPNTRSEDEASPTRDRLVRTAARLFLARSYQSVGVNEICADAKVHKGSFYHFFPSKSDLAIAVIDRHANAMWALLDEHERAARGPVNKIRATAEVVNVVQTSLVKSFGRVVGCPLGNLAVELSTTEDVAGRHVAKVLRQWEERVAGHCRDAEAVNLLALRVDPDELAHMLIATMQGMILLAKVSDSDVSVISGVMHRVIDSGVKAA
jgi:TetR/AcrR family transcriptional regulator, transcriptional repressor for nem operon